MKSLIKTDLARATRQPLSYFMNSVYTCVRVHLTPHKLRLLHFGAKYTLNWSYFLVNTRRHGFRFGLDPLHRKRNGAAHMWQRIIIIWRWRWSNLCTNFQLNSHWISDLRIADCPLVVYSGRWVCSISSPKVKVLFPRDHLRNQVWRMGTRDLGNKNIHWSSFLFLRKKTFQWKINRNTHDTNQVLCDCLFECFLDTDDKKKILYIQIRNRGSRWFHRMRDLNYLTSWPYYCSMYIIYATLIGQWLSAKASFRQQSTTNQHEGKSSTWTPNSNHF